MSSFTEHAPPNPNIVDFIQDASHMFKNDEYLKCDRFCLIKALYFSFKQKSNSPTPVMVNCDISNVNEGRVEIEGYKKY
jgi:hypothetical protein